MKWLALLMILVITQPEKIVAQSGRWALSLAAKGNYTTTSRVFSNPDSPSDEIRSQYAILDGIYGVGLELRLTPPDENFFISLSTEYVSRIRDEVQPVAFIGPPRYASVKDGFRLIPIELGVHIPIPLGSEKMQASMGGGVGAYYGSRVLSVAGVDAPQQNRAVGFGIHVESSLDYRVIPWLVIRGEMRFRDPEVIAENRFESSVAMYQGSRIPLPANSFRTRINVNGISFGLGVVVGIF